MSEEQKIEFIVCPACNGLGKSKYGLSCSNCGGMGIGVFLSGFFYYWGPKINSAVIGLRRLKKKIDIIINLFSLAVGLAGLAAFGWWLFSNGAQSVEYLFFWRHKHWLILFFWVSLIFDMFVFYRLSEEEAAKQKIKKIKSNGEDKTAELPDNWQSLKKYKRIVDVSAGFSDEAISAVEEAYILARQLKQGEVKIMHLFFVLFKDRAVLAFFSRLNVDAVKLIKKIKEQIMKIALEEKGELSRDVKKALIEAYLNAYWAGEKKVKVLHFILSCYLNDSILSEILYEFEIAQDKIANAIAWFRIDDKMIEEYRIYRKMSRFKPASTMDRAYTAVATPALNHFAYDLTIAAKWARLPYCVAREKEIKDIFEEFLSGHTGVILVGEVGVGKNTIVEGIAQLMAEENVPRILKDKRLVKLDISRLISGATPSEAQERLIVIIDEVIRAGNIILYIQNIENMIGITSGREESMDLSEVLSGAIERKNIFCLATATNQNYVNYVEYSPLGNVFADVKVKEPAGNQAIQIIASKIGRLEAMYKVYFSYNAIENVIELTNKYIHDKFLPAKAVEILELVAVKVAESRGKEAIVAKDDVAEAVSNQTGIPMAKITEKESDVLLNLEDLIHERMINQEEAVNMVAASLRRARAEMRENKRPIASFLFLGPTGVGKTELAKTIAATYFRDEKKMIRLDMSEYQHQDSIEKMLGNANSKGYLTEAVRKAPFSLVLLDEFEKAHPDILNLFLQVMDDGRLTDGQGKTIDFTNTIIIATSNADAVYIEEQVMAGTNIEKIKEVLLNERLNKTMRPELINRFDGIIVFKPLTEDNLVDITQIMLKKTEKMLLEKGIRMRAEESGIRILAHLGFDPKFGARPLRRLIQDRIENIIANMILSGELVRRDTVVIDETGNVMAEKGRKL
jgi:ATP-dependent Clp protease ATP-binding subunit ClpC